MKINIAIDGPSGAGKSTISDILAKKLDYIHLDTGAMYRVVALKCIENSIRLDSEYEIVNLIDKLDFEQSKEGLIFCNNQDVTRQIRENNISMAASDVSKLQNVRKALVSLQQKIAENKGYIVDGRDICEVVLPNAEVKIFLTASPEERARRRCEQNKENNIPFDYEKILEDIKKRDYQDSHREFSPLRKTEDATLIDSTNNQIEDTVKIIMELVNKKI